VNIWDCLETLMRENNPRLMVIVEIDDARYLLAGCAERLDYNSRHQRQDRQRKASIGAATEGGRR
jgi:hypothetical protein